MKYISETSIVNSWKNIIELGERNKAPLTKFFGFLELLTHINLTEGRKISSNFQYNLISGKLSNSLQDKYYFSSSPREFGSSEVLYIIFPNSWIDSVFQVFLKSIPLPVVDIATLCLQNEEFPDDFTAINVVDMFKRKYFLTDASDKFFTISDTVIDFSVGKPNRQNIFINLKRVLGLTEDLRFTLGFTKNLFEKNPGELTAGPFIQPLYAGQENLKCLFIASFDLKSIYNISPATELSHSSDHKAFNKIIYGAPGTGKSFELRRQSRDLGFLEENTVRLTFHPNYNYQQFVGTYKPTPIYRSVPEERSEYYGSDRVTKLTEPQNREPLIDYSFVPGSFLVLLIQAIKNPTQNYLLIIEEINRAVVSSVFGDVFQLLDRDSKGISEYDVEFNSDITNYLASQGISSSRIRLPSNFFIWATMNSADQGVMPLDAAFKRRWSFEYLPLDSKSNEVGNRIILFRSEKINWNFFRSTLNNRLKQLGVSEDKLIGPFFLNSSDLGNPDSIKNKLLLYLRDDVVRHNPGNLFLQKTFSDIINDYDNGLEIFVDLNFDLQITERSQVS